MKDYTHDKATVDTWLLNGGAKIVLEVIRRMGWTVKVATGEDWEYVDDVVVEADRKHNSITLNGAKSPCQQAMFAVAVVTRNDPVHTQCHNRNWFYPLFSENDKFPNDNIWLCYSFIDKIRLSSEATVALIGKEETT